MLFSNEYRKILKPKRDVNETLWTIGSTLIHPHPDLKKTECGEGKFHACATPTDADQFRDTTGDRYIALSVPIKKAYAWPKPDYPFKIGFSEGTVLYECDKKGNKV